MTKIKKIRRDVLKRKIEKGLMEAKCDYSYTDDYIFDNATGFGKTGWMDARVSKGRKDFVQGKMNFNDWDFSTKTGTAWINEDGTIDLIIHQNLSYTLREKK